MVDAIDWRGKCNDCLKWLLVRDQAEGEKSILYVIKSFDFLFSTSSSSSQLGVVSHVLCLQPISCFPSIYHPMTPPTVGEGGSLQRKEFFDGGHTLSFSARHSFQGHWAELSHELWRSHVRPDQSSRQALRGNINFMQCLCCFSVDHRSRDRGIHDRARLINSLMTALAEVPEHRAVTVITIAREERCIHFKVAAPSLKCFEVSTRSLYFQPVSFLYMYINNYGKRAPFIPARRSIV